MLFMLFFSPTDFMKSLRYQFEARPCQLSTPFWTDQIATIPCMYPDSLQSGCHVLICS